MACEAPHASTGTSGGAPSHWREGVPVLPGSRVTLREPRLSDAASLHESLATEVVARFMSHPPGSPAAFARFIAWVQAERLAGRCVCFAMVPAGSADAVGLIQLRQLEPGFGTAEWGFALGQRYWGTGLFREASRLAVDFAFRDMAVHRLEARTALDNNRGRAVLARLGAHPEGVLRQSLIDRGRRMDQVLWSLLAEEWLAANPVPLSGRERTLLVAPEATLAALAPGSGAPRAAWRDWLPALSSPALVLRELDRTDAPSLFTLLTTPVVVRFILAPPQSIEGFQRFIEWSHARRDAGTHVCFGVVPRGAPHAVGLFQIQRLDPSFRTAEWGFALGSPFWGTGLFLEGARLVLHFAFETLGVRRLEARTATGNVRGEFALRKVGAVREAQLRRSFLLGGTYMDDCLWSILDDDYRQACRTVENPEERPK